MKERERREGEREERKKLTNLPMWRHQKTANGAKIEGPRLQKKGKCTAVINSTFLNQTLYLIT